ncbi:MAG: hypothetical protein U0903_00125 [Planctomycetales bacterium]
MSFIAKKFSPEMQAGIQSFDCGTLEYARLMSEWIKGSACLESMKTRGTEVWLFYNASGDLIGFGALGPGNWPLPNDDSPRQPLLLIPALAVGIQFQGIKSDFDPEKTWAVLICLFLIEKAALKGAKLLGLFVHQSNVKAIRLYEHLGFKKFPSKKENHIRMVLDLTPEPA